MLNRVKKSKLINEIWVATGISKENDKLCKLLLKKNIRTFRGDDNNVLSRFMDIASKTKAKYIVRLTADCPLVDASIIDKAITSITKYKLDYVSNILKRTYPDGLDVEVFSRNTLKKTFENVTDDYSKEHVTTYMHGLHEKSIKKENLKNIT